MEVEISELLDVDEEIQRFASALLEAEGGERRSKRKSRASVSVFANWLTKLAIDLNSRTSSMLALELHRTRLDGPRDVLKK